MPVVKHFGGIVLIWPVAVLSPCAEDLVAEHSISAEAEVKALIVDGDVETRSKMRVRISGHGLVIVLVEHSVSVEVEDLEVARLRRIAESRLAVCQPGVEFALGLEHSVRDICMEISDRIAYLGTIQLCCLLYDGPAVDDAFAVIDSGDGVLVV